MFIYWFYKCQMFWRILYLCFRQLFCTHDGGTIALDWLLASDGKINIFSVDECQIGILRLLMHATLMQSFKDKIELPKPLLNNLFLLTFSAFANEPMTYVCFYCWVAVTDSILFGMPWVLLKVQIIYNIIYGVKNFPQYFTWVLVVDANVCFGSDIFEVNSLLLIFASKDSWLDHSEQVLSCIMCFI